MSQISSYSCVHTAGPVFHTFLMPTEALTLQFLNLRIASPFNVSIASSLQLAIFRRITVEHNTFISFSIISIASCCSAVDNLFEVFSGNVFSIAVPSFGLCRVGLVIVLSVKVLSSTVASLIVRTVVLLFYISIL